MPSLDRPAPPATVAWVSPGTPPALKPLNDVEAQILEATTRLQQRPVVRVGALDEQAMALFVRDLLSVAETQAHWEAAWDHLDLPEELKADAGRLAVQSLLSVVGGAGHYLVSVASAIAHLSKSHRVKLRVVEECLTELGSGTIAFPESWQVVAIVATHWFPQPAGADWGWSRAGWSLKEWWRIVDRLLTKFSDDTAFQILLDSLRRMQDYEAGTKIYALTERSSGHKVWDEQTLEKLLGRLGELSGCFGDELAEKLGTVHLSDPAEVSEEDEDGDAELAAADVTGIAEAVEDAGEQEEEAAPLSPLDRP